MNSLPPKEYASLPKLEPPAGYICVLRDIDRDVYRIDSTDHPASYVDALLAELTGAYGIELLSILKADDLVASESQLFDAHHARLSEEWLMLDAYQMRALRKSDLRILDYSSLYISQRQSTAETNKTSDGSVATPREAGAAGQSHSAGAHKPSAPVLDHHRYGARRPRQPEADEPESWRQALSDKFDDFLHNHPGLVIAFALLLMLLMLIHIWGEPYPY